MQRRLLLLMSAILVLTTIAIPPAIAHDDDNEGGGTYLALGDSIAAGMQRPDFFTDRGYTNLLFDKLQDKYGFDEFVNLGCPGEDTREFISGDNGPSVGSICYGTVAPFPPGGPSQLQAALAVIADPSSDVRLITITMGANDIFRCEVFTDDCFLTELALMSVGLGTIIGALQAAAPGVPIVGMNYYNSSLALWITDPALADASQELLPFLNGSIQGVYAAFGVPVADVESAFDTFDANGAVPKNVRSICKYTQMCEKGPGGTYVYSDYDPVTLGTQTDIHPTDKGYEKIAQTFEKLIKGLRL